MRGIVQGVGFRPFVYALARKHGPSGARPKRRRGSPHRGRRKTAEALNRFVTRAGGQSSRRLAVVEVSWSGDPLAPPSERPGFPHRGEPRTGRAAARSSPRTWRPATTVSSELFDPADRRHRYPFTNCTNCGPRFTITRQVPYDRARTTMAPFEMCPDCQREYDDPANRRFHAQPNACSVCGPQVRLLDKFGHEPETDDPIRDAVRLLREGRVLAIKGLGGYHLACDPFDAVAVRALRSRKVRQDKPFALMARDVEQVREMCRVGPEEETLLTSPPCPVVLLERRPDSGVAEEVAPRQKTLGVMLAYTPLHHLLLRDAGIPLVMTSGNRSDEPIAYKDEASIRAAR